MLSNMDSLHNILSRDLIENVIYPFMYSIEDAVNMNNVHILKCLARNGVNIHAKNEWAVQLASSKGYLEVVKYLVEKCGADIHADNEWAVRYASEYGHLNVVKYLVSKGARLND